MDILGKIERAIKRWGRRLKWLAQVLRAERHYYIDMQSYAFEHPDKMRILSLRQERLSYAYSDMNDPIHDDLQVWLKKACIHNATCFIYSDIILLEDGRCIYPIKEIEGWDGIVDFMDEILLKDTDTWCKLKKCHQTKHYPTAIKIGGMFGFNYYHFMFQILPKLFETSDIDLSVPLLLDRAAADVASMKQLVEWCNKEKRDVIYMDYDVAYNIDELYVISVPNLCVPNWKGDDISSIPVAMYSPTAVDMVSKYLLTYKDTGIYPEKIFISRKSTKRRAYNETELWEVAEQYGFVKVYPEELDMAQQMALFNNAKTIVAANGAALSNLIFCSVGCKLIMLCSGKFIGRIFTPLMPMKAGSIESLMPVYVSKGYQNSFETNPRELEELLIKEKK